MDMLPFFWLLVVLVGGLAWYLYGINKWYAHLKPAVQNISNVEELIREIRKAPDVDWRYGS